jgi:hypothetical protein
VLRNNVTWMVLIPISDYSFAKCSWKLASKRSWPL